VGGNVLQVLRLAAVRADAIVSKNRPPPAAPLHSALSFFFAVLKIFYGWRIAAAGAGLQFLHAGLLLQAFGA
jgi:hypothetical protein